MASRSQANGRVRYKLAQEGKQRTHQRAGKQRAHASRTRRFAKHRGHRSTQHQWAAFTVVQRLLETHDRHRFACQQLALAVVKAHLHIRRLRRHLQQLPAGLLTITLQYLQLGGQQRTQRRGIATPLIEHEGARAHQEGQAVGQPERQKQLPEQAPAHHSTISM